MLGDHNLDYDYIIIGSGFGGSVSAMRLAQKGYKVAVLEAGKRYRPQDFPKTNWNVRKFLWAPKIFCYGIQRLTLLKDVLVLSGAGVGGGSLVYANTLYIPPDRFFEHPAVQKLGGKPAFLPYYHLAQKMLGVTENPRLWEPDRLLQETAAEMGKGHTFVRTPVGVFFGTENKTVRDPYFEGEGPDRTGCNFCGGCMVGCRFDAKNTLDKNYLYFAEKFGTTVVPETQVTDVIPLNKDGSAGYEIRTRTTTALGGFPHRKFTAKGVVFSAGVLGTVNLLLKLKEKGRLPNLSDELGRTVRTNSESIIGVKTRDKDADYSRGIAITSSVHPDEHTHIEPVRYSRGSDALGFLSSIQVDGGGKIPRQLKFLWNILKAPVDFLRMSNPFGFARRTIILLIMQTVDNSIRLTRKRGWRSLFFKRLTSASTDGTHIPSYIPIGNEFARRLAARMNGIAGSSLNEVLLDIPMTAHILGGCAISDSPATGVIDETNHVFGYRNMLVCDGSMIPANLGVNPSLSITAFTEKAMAQIPLKAQAPQFLKAEKKWQVTQLLTTGTPVKFKAPSVSKAKNPVKKSAATTDKNKKRLPRSKATPQADLRQKGKSKPGRGK